MSWQVAILALLAATLAVGFGWYERTRPSSRVVALVAALAALAVAGRVALAPLPNVVATTDVALITGYALGGAPGFAVGALAGLVSNFWLGQGPWTPWQMAGWGLVGLGGATLATLAGRRIGRLGLAAAAALAGVLYGALLDLSVMVNFGGEQSLDRYVALAARGLPFNLAHAAGNAALMLAAGPALVRMLARFRERSEVRWRDGPLGRAAIRGGGALAVVAVLAVALADSSAPPHAAAGDASGPARTATLPVSERASAPGAARRWLEARQQRDGGFPPAPGEGSSAAMTGWAVLGLEAAGRNPLDVRSGGRSAIGYLRRNAAEIRSTGDLERTILALEAAGVDSGGFAGRDLGTELKDRRRSDGSFERQVNLTAFGVLALRAAGRPAAKLRRSANWLHGAQNRDGGWGSRASAASEPDSTGAALQALAAARGSGGALDRGARYLRRAQHRDGGYALTRGASTNSQSTAWAIQGLVAAGVDPAGVREGGRSPLDYLAARQASDGHYRYSKASDQTPVWVTAQALVAVRRKAFPLTAVPRRASDGGGGGRRSGAADGGGGVSAGSAGDAGARLGGGKRTGAAGGRGQNASNGRATRGEPRDGMAAIPVRGAPAASTGEGAGDDADRYAVGGLLALALALGGGFLWYRRRLP